VWSAQCWADLGLASDLGMPGFQVIFTVFPTLHSFQYFQSHVCTRSREVLPTVYDPLDCADEENDTESDDTIV
jgi:hypothetical protein